MRNTTINSPIKISVVAALSLSISASSVTAQQQQKKFSWGIAKGDSIQIQNSMQSGQSGVTTITANGNSARGRIEVTQGQQNSTLSSLLIQSGTSLQGDGGLLVIGKEKENDSYMIPTITNRGTLNTEQYPVINVEGSNKTIQNFINEGTIKSSNEVAIKVRGTNNTITTFSNSGLIKAKKEALTFYNTTITSFDNKGTIENESDGSGRSIDLYNATITNFTNSGTIKAQKNHAVYLNDSTITNFINDTNGLIDTQSQGNGLNGQNDFKHSNAHQVHAAIRVQAGNGKTSSIQSLENKGTIKGKRAGISLARQAGDSGGKNNINIGTIKNSGTIEAGNAGIYMVGDFMTIQNIINEGTITITNGTNNGDYSAGIVVAAVDKKNPIYADIQNKGTITGGQYGVFIEGGTINNLKNSGTIEGKKDGIAFFNAEGTLHTTITNLEIEQGGIIRGEQNGINISKNNGDKDQTVVGNLTIAQDATVEGINGSGLVLGKDNKNGSSSDKYQLTGKIEVNGTLKGKTAAIINKGELGSNEGGDVLVIGEQGKIEGVVKNESGGTLKGNITNKGTGTLEIDNKGTVGNKTVIKNDGGGSIKILDWKLENQDNGSGNLKTVQFEGNGGNITLEKLTISETNTDITKVAEAIQGSQKAQAVAHTQVKTSDGNGAVTITGDLLRGLVANIDGSKTAAAALNRTLIATATARATFLDTVMGNALNTLSFLHHKDRASSSLGSYKNANLYANATTIRNDLLSQSSSYA
ncbi:hypothetical protein, partial [Helicobacter sp. 10-6591]|uniref:hypothetical protein n=1 Tax=Helicobacter sp. 10-6591 TaxID=2004998 RepID=UPI000DCBEF0F